MSLFRRKKDRRVNKKHRENDSQTGAETHIEDVENEFIDYVSPLGITKHRLCTEDDDERVEIYEDPGWEYVYNEYEDSVSCPVCGNSELRYHNGQCCCIECDSIFTDQEIDDWADEWFHA